MAVMVWTEPRVRPALEELLWMLGEARSRARRPLSRFMVEEVRLPTGPMAGEPYNLATQPYSRLFCAAVDSGRYTDFLSTGPTQSGKTLTTALGPMAWHLFEWQEPVIFGLPNDDMRRDKWEDDVLPMIEATRYRELLPTRGPGSRGGDPGARIRFSHGVVVRFMTGGGADKSRAGKTARVLVATEVEAFDLVKSTSAEGTQIEQLEARTHAFGSRARKYKECTVTTSTGYVWRKYAAGSMTRPWYPCAHCGTWVSLDRENFHGWQEAETEVDAFSNARLVCTACGVLWTDDERRWSVGQMAAVHRGQRIVEASGPTASGPPIPPPASGGGWEGNLGQECPRSLGVPVIEGDAPKTFSFTLRWNGAENLLMDQGQIGVAEWQSARAEKADEAERAMCQFYWARAIDDDTENSVDLTVQSLTERLGDWVRGVCPADTMCVTATLDMGKHVAHWLVLAWREDGSPHVVDYGTITVRWRELGLENAITSACWEFAEICEAGWLHENQSRVPDVRWIDSGGEWAKQVYDFCKTTNYAYRPMKGFGASQDFEKSYMQPKSTGSTVLHIGEQYHVAFVAETGVRLIEVNADYWKSYAYRRLMTPVEKPGGLTLYRTLSRDHRAFALHLLAERRELEWVPETARSLGPRKGGWRERWVKVNRNNHWGDTFYMGCAAAHHGGVRLEIDSAEGDGGPRPVVAPPRRVAGRKRRGVVMYRK
ncbi:MAG: phage terminase large subunit family protein [Candidatus Hydrogenedentes bacterium]|nr:phage terminase large subunit family protein [Candidatus Hydrogenedentota bacterium]